MLINSASHDVDEKKEFLLYYTYYDYYKNIVTVTTIESDS